MTYSKKRKNNFVSYTKYAFTEPQIRKMLQACSVLSDYIMILLGYRYGFRREDIINIRIADIDLVNAQITYYEHKRKRHRTIPIEPDVVAELRRYLNTVPDKQVTIFPFKDGSTAWQHLQDICEIAEIPKTDREGGYRPFHALRGTCVKLRQAQGWTIHEVSALIGDTVETVNMHYATVTPGELAEKMKVGKA